MATVGLSKVFILDKYFTELQKYWETEKKLKENDRSEPCSIFTGDEKRFNEASPTQIYDLIYLQGPLTEDIIYRTLQARFHEHEYFTNIGPVLLSINNYHKIGNALTLNSVHQDAVKYPQLLRIVEDAVRQQRETGYPQAIILSGESGSGKTYSSMLLLRQLFDAAGGGPETDSFKHLAAAFTVLWSLGSAKTAKNRESSRIGQFIEVQITDGALYRTKIHCYFLDQTRVLRQSSDEKSYHIFYQLLAGLTKEERTRLNLDGYNVHNLRYLNRGDTQQNEVEDAARFEDWKASLSILGIPFMDVVRVLAAILLLGNVQFNDKSNGSDHDSSGLFDSKSNNEIKAVASLLGVSAVALNRGLTTRIQNIRGQLVKTIRDGVSASKTRDALAKALYCRTVTTIVRRANSMKRIGSSCGTMSSDSNESMHIQVETGSHHASTIGSSGAKSQKSLNVLNSAVKHATDGFIGILDIFGFEDVQPSQLQHLCINLCAETMQHFYNTHIFKSSTESCKEEGVIPNIEIEYADNVPCIDLISSLHTGLLSILDVETLSEGTSESYVQKIRLQHHGCSRFFDIDCQKAVTSLHDSQHESIVRNGIKPDQQQPHMMMASRFFGIRHFTGDVIYNATDFLDTNRDTMPDDIVAVFHKSSCTFGFVSHLFGLELKTLLTRDTAPCGLQFRISPTNHNDLQHGDEIINTFTQDFHTRLDNLLRTLVHAKPHFIRCIKSNDLEKPDYFDRKPIIRQIRALQILETVNLMACGLPHRMRFRAFNSRFRCINPFRYFKKSEDKAIDECKALLDNLRSTLEELESINPTSSVWALGKRHIFLSEGARQQLELLRSAKREYAAIVIQTTWRGWNERKKWPSIKNCLLAKTHSPRMATNHQSNGPSMIMQTNSDPLDISYAHHHHHSHHHLNTNHNNEPSSLGHHTTASLGALNKPRPQPISGTPPLDSCDQRIVAKTCSLFGLDLRNPPPVPPSRSYTVSGNAKLSYPQTRVMKMDFPDELSNERYLRKGEVVMVSGASPKRGHLIVDHNGQSYHVPYQFMELKSNIPATGMPVCVNI
ncbi:unconventional myosin-IXb-like dachs isoform X2 [Brevipalpus obovatus]|uniref:unconventional myosin-IXb-like dachs isoform X2 n=1 Tax=Brevipalpus obovatus TaxID=246614 RepID=UPI003D9E53D5